MIDYTHLRKYLKILYGDIYPQPTDPGHDKWTREVIDLWIKPRSEIKSVIDVGCGQGNSCLPFLEQGIFWEGITIGQVDYEVCLAKGYPVKNYDMSLTPYKDEAFDLVFARHVLEHSPMPLISLMEWHRIGKEWLIVVVPNPDTVINGGVNHYYMLTVPQWRVLFRNAGWDWIESNFASTEEFRFLLKKGTRKNSPYQ